MGLFGKGVARICAVVAASSAREMAVQLRRALRETPTVELRLDSKSSPARGAAGHLPSTRGRRLICW